MGDASTSTKDLLRKDLRVALRAREALTVSTLRSLIAAIDNAQAVPVADAHQRYIVRPFSDGSAEATRRALSETDVRRILEEELAVRARSATECECHGRLEAASRLRAEAAIVARYANKA